MSLTKINENPCFAIELSTLNFGVRYLTIEGKRKKVHKSALVELTKEMQILIGSFLDCSSTMAYRATCTTLKKLDKRLFLLNEKMVSAFLKKSVKKPIPHGLFHTILTIRAKITCLDLSRSDSFRLTQNEIFSRSLLQQFPNVKDLSVAGQVFVRDRDIETFVQSFPHLSKINLKGCYKITAEGFDTLLTLDKLQEVILCSDIIDQISFKRGDISKVDDPIQTILKKAGPYIKKLNLWLDIEDGTVIELGKCFPNLNDLSFRYQKAAIFAEIPLAFPNLTTLEFFCRPSDEINEGLRRLQTLKLKKLRLRAVSLDMSSMNHIAELSNLMSLFIDNCTKASFKPLSKLRNLRELALSAHMDDEGIEAIGKLVNLETLHLPISLGTTPQAFASLQQLKNLERLHVYGDINQELLPLIPKIENLKELIIERSSFYFSRKFFYKLKLPKNLIYLTLITKIVGLTSYEKSSLQKKYKQRYHNLCEIYFTPQHTFWKGKALL
jgi:Leucine-rich repeat (LRR) protein